MLETFLSLSWVWLILHTALSTYTLSYQWAWVSLIGPAASEVELQAGSSQTTLGVAVIFLSAILKLSWISCWLPCLYHTWWKGRSWTSGSTTKLIMQADRDYGESADSTRDSLDNLVIGVSGRPRHCSICRKKCGDRVYHDTAFGRCRPLFDHYCSFILVSVYLRTMKLYLFMLFFLPLDVIFTIVSSAFATSQSSGKSAAMFFAPIITASFAIGFLAAVNALSQMYHLAWKNEVQNEYINRNLEPITLVFKVGVRHRRAILWWKQCKFNPWDLGLKENLKQVFGETWFKMLCPWIPPARVTNYYNRRGLPTSDFPFREEIWKERTKMVDALAGFTGVIIEGSEQHQAMAINSLTAPAPQRQQEGEDLPEQQRPRAPNRRLDPRRTGTRSSGFEPSSETEQIRPRRRGDPERRT